MERIESRHLSARVIVRKTMRLLSALAKPSLPTSWVFPMKWSDKRLARRS